MKNGNEPLKNCNLTFWFRDDIANVLSAVILARAPLTGDEARLVVAVAAGFGLNMADLPWTGWTAWPVPEKEPHALASPERG